MVYIAYQLLAAATSLLLLVQGNPGVDYYTQQYAIQAANNAIQYANQVINQGGTGIPTQPQGPLTSTIKVPYIAAYNSNYGSQKFGCDEMIVYSTKNIAPTTMPLTAAYQELFSGTQWSLDQSLSQYWSYINSGYGLYNSIPRLYNLKFDRASIENGVAHVYLRGDFSGANGTCDNPRPQAQIEAVAKQFSNVYSVQIHLSN